MHGAVMLAEYQACHMRAVLQAESLRPMRLTQRIQLPDNRSIKRRMRQVGRSIEHRDTDARVSEGQRPQMPEARQLVLNAGKLPNVVSVNAVLTI